MKTNDLDWMKKLLDPGHHIESMRSPHTIEVSQKLYRFATNGWMLIAVEVEDGIADPEDHKLFDPVRAWIAKKLEVTGRASFAALREFCGAPWVTRCHCCGNEREYDPEHESSSFRLREGFLNSWPLNLELLARPLRFLSAETVDVEISKYKYEPTYIDGPGWRIVLMGMSYGKPDAPRFELDLETR